MKGLVKKSTAEDGSNIYGAVELDDDGFFISEASTLPVTPHLPDTWDVFDDDKTIADLEERFKIDFSEFDLVYLPWLKDPYADISEDPNLDSEIISNNDDI